MTHFGNSQPHGVLNFPPLISASRCSYFSPLDLSLGMFLICFYFFGNLSLCSVNINTFLYNKRSVGQKISACGRHLYYCELRERLIVPFQSQNGQKFPAWQALPLLWTERWAEGALSKPNRKKNPTWGRHLYYSELRDRLRGPFQRQKGQKSPACDRHLYHCELREVDGALSKAKMVKKNLPAAGS